VYDKFHIMQHAGKAVDEVRRAEFFRKGGSLRGLVKGKRWLLLSRWVNLDSRKRQLLNELFRLNRRMMSSDWNHSRNWRRCCSVTWKGF
jgi:transposase